MDDGKTEAGWYLCSFAVLGVNWNEPPICISFHAFEFCEVWYCGRHVCRQLFIEKLGHLCVLVKIGMTNFDGECVMRKNRG